MAPAAVRGEVAAPRSLREIARYGSEWTSPSRCSRVMVLLTVALVDAQPVGQVDRAGLALRRDQIGDQLDIVLGDLVAMIAPGTAEGFRLPRPPRAGGLG